MQLIKARATHATNLSVQDHLHGAQAIAYLDEHGVDHSVAGGGDAGRDDAEAQRLQRPAHLGHGVPAPAAPHAHHRHLLPRLRHLHLHARALYSDPKD